MTASRRVTRIQPASRLALIVTVCCLEAIYWSSSAAGHVTQPPRFYSTLLNDLAEGFRPGTCTWQPNRPPRCWPSHNPFDPATGASGTGTSASTGATTTSTGDPFRRCCWRSKTLLRIHGVIYDEVVVFWLASLQLAAGTWMIAPRRALVLRRAAAALQVLAVVVIGLANPTPYNLARGGVYEAAIVGGQAFLLLGVAFAAESVARHEGRGRWAVAAGIAWVLALGCRVSLAPAVALMVIATALVEGRLRASRRPASAASFWLGCRSGCRWPWLFALLLYNRLRFGAWLEFGRQYQLTWIAAPSSWRYVLPSLYSFLLRTPALSCRFPFFFAPDMGARAFPAWFHLPEGYFVYEQVAGTLLGCPWSWPRRRRDGCGPPLRWPRRRRRASAWAVVVAGVCATVALLPATTVASATNRYLGDAVGGIVLLGTFGAFT